MANSMRVVWDNAADRATLTAGSAAITQDNLKTDSKTEVWRSVAATTSTNVSASWTALENISCVVFPYCNFSPTATMRLRLTNEASVTNKLTYSQTLSNAAYTKSATTIGSASTAPDGTTTADLVLDTVATSLHSISQSNGLNSGNSYAFSMFVKANGRTRIRLENANLGANADFNLTTGVVVTSANGGTGAITALPNSWFRVTLLYTAAATSSQNHVMYLQDSSGSSTFLGNGTSGVYSWGWQLEIGTAATSYYPTTATSLVRPLGYIDSWQAYSQDSGYAPVCASTASKVSGLTATQASSAYQYGGGVAATAYAVSTPCYGARVDIIDTSNLQGYLEASRLVIGGYFAPIYDAEVGAKISFEDTGKNFRNDAGNLMSDIGTRNKVLDVNLGMMQEVDRAALWKIVSYCGTSYPVFMSVYPGNANKDLEQAYTVYGKFSSISKLASKAYGVWEAPLTVEGI